MVLHVAPPQLMQKYGIALTTSDIFMAKRLGQDELLFSLCYCTLDSDYRVEMSNMIL